MVAVGRKIRLSLNPGTVAVYLSPGGQGLHIVAAVDPVPNFSCRAPPSVGVGEPGIVHRGIG